MSCLPWTGEPRAVLSTPGVASPVGKIINLLAILLLSLHSLQTLGHLSCKGALLAQVHGVHQEDPRVLFCQAVFQMGSTWRCSFPDTGLCTSPHWTLWSSCQAISAARWGPSVWQHIYLAYQICWCSNAYSNNYAKVMLYLSIKPTCCTLTMAWPHSALFWIYRTSGIFKVTFTYGVYVVFFHA